MSLCGREVICFLVGRGCVSRCPQDAPPFTSQQIRELFLQICGYSVYAHEDELRQGYVRLGGGCRVGVCGSAVMEGGVVRGLRDVTSLVFRIPRRRWGCADRLFTGGIPVEKGVLVAGPPSSGKTTFLRLLQGEYPYSGTISASVEVEYFPYEVANLSRTGLEVLAFLQKLNREGTTVILITHDNGIAATARRCVRLTDGRIVEDQVQEVDWLGTSCRHSKWHANPSGGKRAGQL